MKPKKSRPIFRSMAALLMLLIIGGWFSQPAAAQTPIRVGCNTELLIEAIREANTHVGLDVIELAPNCTYPIRNNNRTDAVNGLPVIIEPLRIEGRGATLLAVESFIRLIHAQAPLTVVDLALQKGASLTVGGAIFAEADLTLIEVEFRENVAQNGGAVYAEAALTVKDSQINKNIAQVFGGGIYSEGPLTLSDTILIDNRAVNGGGGLFTMGPTTITNARIAFNKADITGTDELKGCGGGIQAHGSLTLNRSQVNANEASRGGGVCALDEIIASGNIFDFNTATLQGGGLHSKATVTLLHNTFSRNKATQFGSALDLAQRRIGNSELINNVWLEQQGPAEVMCLFCAVQSLGQEVIVAHNTIANAESRSINAIIVRAGKVNLVNSIIVNHKVGLRQFVGQVQTNRNLYFGNGQDELGSISSGNNHLVADPRFVDLTNGNTRLQTDSPALGQALANFSPTVDRRGVHRPQGNGPDLGAYEFDEGVIPASHVLTLAGCDAGELVGAVEQANETVGAHRIELAANCTYNLTTAAGPGPNGDPTGLPVVTEYLVIAGNGATVQRSDSAGDFRLWAVNQATLVMRDVTLQNGRSINEGGGMYVGSNKSPGEELALTNVTFRGNTSTKNEGGGLFVEGSRVTINRSTFENNRADNGGGLNTVSNPGLRLIETTFRNNIAESEGGAVYTSGSPLQIEDSLFENNRALAGEGGGIGSFDSMHITGSTFKDNSAPAGGAIYAANQGTLLILTGNTLVGNEASVGAGLLFELGTSGNLIANNLWADHATTATPGSAVITLKPRRNSQPGSVDLIHNTIASPTLAEGSGVHVEGVSATLRNNIISNYQTAVTTVAANGTELIAEHNLTFTEGTTETGVIDNQNNRLGDPRFVNLANGDFHLQADSPAIDNGLDAGISIDLDGTARPLGEGFDIGAYEFDSDSDDPDPDPDPTPTPNENFTVYLPLVVR